MCLRRFARSDEKKRHLKVHTRSQLKQPTKNEAKKSQKRVKITQASSENSSFKIDDNRLGETVIYPLIPVETEQSTILSSSFINLSTGTTTATNTANLSVSSTINSTINLTTPINQASYSNFSIPQLPSLSSFLPTSAFIDNSNLNQGSTNQELKLSVPKNDQINLAQSSSTVDHQSFDKSGIKEEVLYQFPIDYGNNSNKNQYLNDPTNSSLTIQSVDQSMNQIDNNLCNSNYQFDYVLNSLPPLLNNNLSNNSSNSFADINFLNICDVDELVDNSQISSNPNETQNKTDHSFTNQTYSFE